jgi:hypothetical protein
MTRTPCATNPPAWDTYREDGNQRRKANRQELQTAIAGCHRCPQFMACITLDPPMDMVQAGVIYTGEANPITIGRFLNEPDPSTACGDMKGRRTGYLRHQTAGEPPCGRCNRRETSRRKESRRRQTRKKPQECSKGHKYTRTTVRLDSVGRRICLTCRPDCVPKEPKPVQMACLRAGHDWNDPRNLGLQSDGGRYCLECKRVDQRVKYQAERVRRAERSTDVQAVA